MMKLSDLHGTELINFVKRDIFEAINLEFLADGVAKTLKFRFERGKTIEIINEEGVKKTVPLALDRDSLLWLLNEMGLVSVTRNSNNELKRYYNDKARRLYGDLKTVGYYKWLDELSNSYSSRDFYDSV